MRFAQERQIPFIADMNADFRDGYGAVPMSNWPDKRASAAICYLDASVRARGNLTIINGATVTGIAVRRPPRHRRDRTGRRRRGEAVHRARDHPVHGRHPFARFPDALRHRARRRTCANTASRCAQTCPASARICPTTPSCSSACCSIATRGRPPSLRPHPDDGVPLFVRAAGRAADRYVHQRAVQDLVEPARLRRSPISRPTLLKPMARGRVSLRQGRCRHAAAGRIQLHRPRPRPQALHAGVPPRGRGAGAREGARHDRRDLSGEIHRPPAPAQPHHAGEQGAERGSSPRSSISCRRWPARSSSTLADRRVDLATLVADDDALAEHIRENVAGTFHPVGTCRMGGAERPRRGGRHRRAACAASTACA